MFPTFPVLDTVPFGLIEEALFTYRPRKAWFRASYINLGRDLTIKTTITRPNLGIDEFPPTIFSVGDVRLAIADDSSVIVPRISDMALQANHAYPQYIWDAEGQQHLQWI